MLRNLLDNYLSLISSPYIRSLQSEKIYATLKEALTYSSPMELARIIESISPGKVRDFVFDLRYYKLISPVFRTPVRTILVCNDKMNNGGVERALSNIMPVWVNAGFKIILVTSQNASKCDYPVPKEVVRCVVSDHDVGAYCEGLRTLIRKENVDAIFVQKIVKTSYCWINLLAIEEKILFFVEYHTSFAMLANSLSKDFSDVPDLLRLADRSVSLSQTNQYFFYSLGIKSYYIPNKSQFHLYSFEKNKPVDAPFEILWVGRPDDYMKQLDLAVEILYCVCKKNNNVHMTIVGVFDSASENNKWIIKKIKKYRLGKMISFPGYQQDVAPFYKAADIFLSTSMTEGYPMTFLEAFSFRLPIVAFDLPYLDLAQNKATISVPQRDVRAAAAAVFFLSKNPEILARLSDEAASVFQETEKFNFKKAWTDFFLGNSLEIGMDVTNAINQTALIIKTWYNETAVARGKLIQYADQSSLFHKFFRELAMPDEIDYMTKGNPLKEVMTSIEYKVFMKNCPLRMRFSLFLKIYKLHPARLEAKMIALVKKIKSTILFKLKLRDFR